MRAKIWRYDRLPVRLFLRASDWTALFKNIAMEAVRSKKEAVY
jgi:hypothetical protein